MTAGVGSRGNASLTGESGWNLKEFEASMGLGEHGVVDLGEGGIKDLGDGGIVDIGEPGIVDPGEPGICVMASLSPS